MVLSNAMRLTRRMMRHAHARDVLPLVTAFVAVIFASLFILVGTAQPMNLRMSRRVVAEPVQVLHAEDFRGPEPAPVRGRAARSEVCPQMNNPGGLRWNPAANAGPWATGGTVRLAKLGVSAPIVKVGVGQNNEMVVPKNAHQVAWLDQGPFPGDTQNAVLAGHIRWNKVTGSFGNIEKMAPGDTVVVELDGKRWEFRVTWTCLFDFNTTLAEQIMGYTNVPSVTLISCGGVYDWNNQTHNKRVAVRAELIGSS